MSFQAFIEEREFLQNVSPRTIEWYKESFKWLKAEQPTDKDLKTFVIAMRQKGLKPISCNNRIRAVKAYLKWLGSDLKLSYLKADKEILPTYSAEQIHKLVHFKPTRTSDKTLHIIIMILLDTGLRISEALTIRVSDIDLSNMLIKVHGKGGKDRLVAFSFELRKVLFRYVKDLNPNDLLVSTRVGGILHRRNVLRSIRRLSKRLGFQPVKRSLHAMRHTYAINYLRQGGNTFALQKSLGHSSLEMTRNYTNFLTEDLQQTQHKVSLLNQYR
jgi:integrase/recombinase XerD